MTKLRFLQMAVVLGLAFCARANADCSGTRVVVIVNKANATEDLSMAQLRRLMLGDMRNWPDKKAVSLVAPDPQSAAFKCVLSAVVRMSEAEYRRYIANAEFRGEEAVQLHTAPSGAAAAKLVTDAAGAIGIVGSDALPALGTSVRVVRINGKQPGEAGYPL